MRGQEVTVDEKIVIKMGDKVVEINKGDTCFIDEQGYFNVVKNKLEVYKLCKLDCLRLKEHDTAEIAIAVYKAIKSCIPDIKEILGENDLYVKDLIDEIEEILLSRLN